MNHLKIIGLLSSSTQFLNFMQDIALTVDPKKSVAEKGKTLFPGDKEGYGNKYVNLVLELLVYLGTKFPKTSKSEPTRFKKILTKLESQNVVLPQEYTYLPKQKKKQQQNRSKPQASTSNRMASEQQRPIQKPDRTTPGGPGPSASGSNPSNTNFQSLVRFSKNKIEIYMGELQDAEQVQEMEKKILSAHQILVGYLAKFNQLGDSVYTPIPGKSQTEFQAIIEQYLKVHAFLEEEKKAYDEEISKNRFDTYYDKIKLKFEEIFPQAASPPANKTQSQSKINKTVSALQKQSKPIATANNLQKNYATGAPDIKRQNYKSTDSRTYENQENPNVNGNGNIQRPLSRKVSALDPRNMVSSIFERLESRSKSPHQGFQDLRKSLQKQKSMIRVNPPSRFTANPKQPKSKSPLPSTLRASKISDPIFQNPPNPSIPYRSYEGQQIPPNRQLEHILFDIKKEQGHRRFKLANFKNKCLLFQSQGVEIGCKSQAIFQEFDGFQVFLALELYFGNKENKTITGLQISFEGDQNCLIYTNPRDLPSTIQPQTQIKHQLMIVPIKVPFSFINMRLMYTSSTGKTRTTVALPTSIFKLSEFERGLSVGEYGSIWPSLTKIYKSQPFKLSQYLAPQSLTRYLPDLLPLTSYPEFSKPGSTTDYELGSIITIESLYEIVLKIIIRPDLTVVLQVGAREPSQDGQRYMRFYLESLQVLVMETNG